ncbi:MAG: DsbA family protein [Alphaproteobacteria bacterium]|nr:DsbA family protein [Alphaproteobacteria bacterium]
MFFRSAALVLGLAALAVVPGFASAQESLTSAQKEEISKLVEKLLLEKPEIIVKGLDAYQANEQKKQEEQARKAIKDNKDALMGEGQPSAGNPKGDVTIVEFFDYNCGYCKRALPDIQALLKEDKNVRFVFKDLPILGPSSVTAAQWALAAHKQGRYFDYHAALMEFQGPKEEATLEKIAADLKLDVAKMKADAASAEIKTMIEKEQALAEKLGINGTPAFIIGDELYPGFIGADGFKAAIAKARKK